LYANEDYIPAAQVEVWEAGYRKGMTCKCRTSVHNSTLKSVSVLFEYNIVDVIQVLRISGYLKRVRYLYSRIERPSIDDVRDYSAENDMLPLQRRSNREIE
jgi:hypothetical protein